MPYRPASQRTRNYEAALIPDNVAAVLTARKSLMVEQQETQQALIVAMETRIREKLDLMGIIATDRVPYLNFGRALFRAQGAQSGVALSKIATAEKAKFVSYGLDPEILDEIIYFVIGEAAY